MYNSGNNLYNSFLSDNYLCIYNDFFKRALDLDRRGFQSGLDLLFCVLRATYPFLSAFSSPEMDRSR